MTHLPGLPKGRERVRRRVAPVAVTVLLSSWLAGCASRPRHAAPRPAAPAPSESPALGEARTIFLGTSVNGAPISMTVFGAGPDVTFVFCAIHGDEPTAAYVGKKLLEHLQRSPDVGANRTIALLAIANPDGVAARTRTNANGVDCNRNFPASNWKHRPGFVRSNPGLRPASEPETRAVIKAIELLKPARIISVHSGLRCNNPDGPPAAAELAALLARHNGYPVQASVGYPTPGSFGSWAGTDLHIPVVTLELPRHNNGEKAWAENKAGLLEALRADPVLAAGTSR